MVKKSILPVPTGLLADKAQRELIEALMGRYEFHDMTGQIKYGSRGAALKPRQRIWLVRHGETHINLRRDSLGWSNSGQNDELNTLTKTGEEQAEELAEGLWLALAGEISVTRPLKLIVSALGRAKQTAQPFISLLKRNNIAAEFCTDARFNEIDLGVWNNKMQSDLSDEALHMQAFRSRANVVLRPQQGECFLELLLRTQLAIEDVNSDPNPRVTVIFSHATAISAIRMNTCDPVFAEPNGALSWTGKGLDHASFMALEP